MLNVSRLPFVMLAMMCLLLGLWTGLIRIGWDFSLHSLWTVGGGPWSMMPTLTMHHGAIMVGGFLGTLISLEKVIPLKKKWLFSIPLLSASSIVFFALHQPAISFIFLILSGAGLILVFLQYFRKDKSLIYILMLAGSVCWFVGNVLLLTRDLYPLAFPWWFGFILFIIIAERLELMKFLPVTENKKKVLILLLILLLTGILFSFQGIWKGISGLALMAISVWLMRYDIIGISTRKEGLPRFIAVALLSGYFSMLLTGVFFIILDDQLLAYDIFVHTFFLGFVFSMIFAHGPIILPGVLGISVKPYHKILYGWLLILHISWMARVWADIFLAFDIRKVSGILSALAILGYFATVAILTTLGQRHAKVL